MRNILVLCLLAWINPLLSKGCGTCSVGIISSGSGLDIQSKNQSYLESGIKLLRFRSTEYSLAKGKEIVDAHILQSYLSYHQQIGKDFFAIIQAPIIVSAKYGNLPLPAQFQDISLQGGYRNNELLSVSDYNVSVMGAIGVEMPTGRYQRDAENQISFSPAYIQTGSESFDKILTASLGFGNSKHSITSSIIHQWNGVNAEDYKFGNVLNIKVSYIRYLKRERYAFSYGLGWQYTLMDKDLKNGEKRMLSGGYLYQAIPEIGVRKGKLSLGIKGQIIVRQRQSQGLLQSQNGAQLSLNYTFQSRK